jgi:thiamine pyrophosphate-dependent acetolactate synthase large subunit-like protein
MVGAMAAATVAEYLLRQLQESGVDHVFGVPGDYVLGFYKILAESPLQHIGTTREDTSAFAADGYARCRGIGALAVTYGVGALNVVNAIAGAHAESSPVVVIFHAETEDEFDHALREALNTVGRPSLVNVNLKANDASPAMRRLDWPSSLDQAWPHPGDKPVAIPGTKTRLSKNPFLTWAGQSVSSA